jgi:hypothetical protein
MSTKKIESEIKTRISEFVLASRRTIDPMYNAYWKDKAKNMANSYNMNLQDIERSQEFNDVKISCVY